MTPGELDGRWRFAVLGGIALGLGLSPTAQARPAVTALGVVPLGAVAIAALRPRGRGGMATAWLALVALVAALAGFLAGAARLDAIDSGALRARPGALVSVTGFVSGVPHHNGGEVSVRIDSGAGRVMAVAREPVGELPIGHEVRVDGAMVPPEPWRRGYLARQGISMVLRADHIEPGPGRRAGVNGAVDAIRERAEAALDRGMPEREASLARGFVLGEDDRIDRETRQHFQRSGLAHLLAVSGENVILLCLLAWPLLALAGLTLRARLVGALLLVAIYVPVTGAGASIQRAGVMGAAGLIAALADRPRSRWYAVLLAVTVTLAVNPRAAGDVGWQLSFAAVIGIMLWASRLTAALAGEAGRGSVKRALIEGLSVTVAATVATAPLMAHHFEQFSPAALPANVLALPAVAPAMWLGMLTAITGQIPFAPVEPINWLDSLFLAYIAQIARWLASPEWAQLAVGLPTVWSVAGAFAAVGAAMELGLAALRRRRGGFRAKPVAVVALIVLVIAGFPGGSAGEPAHTDGLLVRVLDVGQGDSILLQPPDGEPVLVDTGPPGDGVEDRLSELGIDELAAVVITHDQSDHSGDLGEVLESVPVERVVYALADPDIRAAALGAGAEPFRLAEGGELDSGGLSLSAVWPPPELTESGGGDPNLRALVLVARWKHFTMLLTADAEAESVPLEVGPVDVLKVSHHGSADEGLDELLDQSVPELAVISVGEGNSYGHPAPATMEELAAHSVPVMRTDRQGEIAISADASGWRVVAP